MGTTIRLNKYLAQAGVSSRRHADAMIAAGDIMVNGKRVFELGRSIDPSKDKVLVKGKPVKTESVKFYLAFHKPKHMLTTMDDPFGRPTVGEVFAGLKQRVFPVGRLDWESEGLLLLTNDGDFAQQVLHPKHEVLKTYIVKVSGRPTDSQLQKLKRGVSIEGGGRVSAKSVHRMKVREGSKQYDWIRVKISEGKNHQVRRMFEKIGFDVLKLQRTAIGGLRLGSLKRGQFIALKPNEVKKIFVTPEEQYQTENKKFTPRTTLRKTGGRPQRRAR